MGQATEADAAQTTPSAAVQQPPLTPVPDAGEQHPNFDAFVSYVSNPDYNFARALESFLERFHRVSTPGETRLRPLRVCVDGSDFSLARARTQEPAPGQKPDQAVRKLLESYLARSRYLIVLCPGLKTKWQDFEIEWWLANRPRSTLFLAVTKRDEVLETPDKFFPTSIVEARLHDEVWFDFRGHAKQRRGGPRTRSFDEERLRLTAELYDSTLGDLQPLWFRQEQRRSRRLVLFAFGVGSVFFVLMMIAFVLRSRALDAERRATEEAKRAERERLVAVEAEKRAVGHQVDTLLNTPGGWLDALPVAMAAAHATLGTNPPVLGGALRRAAATAVPVVEIPNDAFYADVDLSEDGRTLVVADVSGRLSVWNVVSGEPIKATKVDDVLRTVQVSRNGSVVVTAGKSGGRIWSTAPLISRCTIPCDGEMLDAALSPDEQRVMTTCTNREHAIFDVGSCSRTALVGTVTTRDTDNRLIHPYFAGENPVATFLTDDSIAAPDLRGGFAVWSISQRRLLRRYDSTATVIAVRGGAKSRRVLALERGRQASVWDLDGPGKPVARVVASSAAISPDGNSVIVHGDTNVELLNLNTGGSTVLSGSDASGFVFSKDGTRVLGSSGQGWTRVWDVRSGDEIAVLQGRTSLVDDATLSGDGTRASTSTRDGVVRVWELPSPQRVHHDLIRAVAFSPDGKRCASGDFGGGFQLWDTTSVRPLPPASGQTTDVFAVEFSANSKVLATASSDSVVVRNASTGQALRKLAGLVDVMEMRLSRDGRRVFARGVLGSNEHVDLSQDAALWDTETGERLAFVGKGNAREARFSPDGALLLIARGDGNDAGRLERWDDAGQSRLIGEGEGTIATLAVTNDGKTLATIERLGTHLIGRLWHDGVAKRLAEDIRGAFVDGVEMGAVFSRDGRWLGTFSQGPVVQLWKADNGELAASVNVGAAMIDALQFLSDGQRFVTHDRDQHAVFWNLGGAREGQLDNLTLAEVAPNGARIAAARGNDLRFIDLSEQAAFAQGCRVLRSAQRTPYLSSRADGDWRKACTKYLPGSRGPTQTNASGGP